MAILIVVQTGEKPQSPAIYNSGRSVLLIGEPRCDTPHVHRLLRVQSPITVPLLDRPRFAAELTIDTASAGQAVLGIDRESVNARPKQMGMKVCCSSTGYTAGS